MNLIIYFTIYLIITSLLGWFANRPKSEITIFGHTFMPGGIIDYPVDFVEIESIDPGLSVEQLKRFNNSIARLGFSFRESEKAFLELKTAMDKVCDGKT